jgi:hypothetical protein
MFYEDDSGFWRRKLEEMSWRKWRRKKTDYDLSTHK